jgi:ornithine cyclodeaminase
MPAAAVSAANVIVTTTPATSPVLEADWLRPGQHVTAMGSDQEHKNEIDAACFSKADLYVPDRLSQTRILGELRSAIAAGLISADTDFAELGTIVAGTAPGRIAPDQITIADLTGTGVQDTAIATHARLRASMPDSAPTLRAETWPKSTHSDLPTPNMRPACRA